MPPHAETSGNGAFGPGSSVIDQSRAVLAQHAQLHTDGRWLEDLTVRVAPHIRD